MTEIVIALLMVASGPTTMEVVAADETTLSTCVAEARKINTDDSHPYIMVCMPVEAAVEG